MSKITVDPGVYLPSSPEYRLVDIYPKSGRPLQSHAKVSALTLFEAPFMATFKVEIESENDKSQMITVDKSVIFKVGDDCRQDVLALQIIRLANEVFKEAHLGLFLYPYRVIATNPGVFLCSNLYF